MDEEALRRVMLYGTCEDCGQPRDVKVTGLPAGGTEMDLHCPACARRQESGEPDPSGGLRLVRRRDHFGMRYTEVVATNPASLAHVGFSLVAVTLAEPLRKALDGHLDAHGCGDPGHPGYAGGFLHCPEAKRLFGLLPDGDRILLA